jgi:hypothetical protein
MIAPHRIGLAKFLLGFPAKPLNPLWENLNKPNNYDFFIPSTYAYIIHHKKYTVHTNVVQFME